MKEKKRQKEICGILASEEFLGERDYKVENCYSEHGSGYNGKLHFHDFYELSVIYEGSSRFLVNGSLYAMGKGSLQLIRPSDYHCQQTGENEHIRYYNLTFSPDFISEELRGRLEEKAEPLCVEARGAEWEELLKLLDKTCRIFAGEPDAVLSRIFIRSSVEMLCAHLLMLQKNDTVAFSQIAQDAIRRGLVYIQKNYREPIRLADAAAAAGLSPNYFSALFHQVMGSRFSDYLTEYRLREAKRYLLTGELSVKQTAAVCGFGSYSYFVTAFRRFFGYSPGSCLRQRERKY